MNLNLFITTLISGGLVLLSFLKLSNALQVNRTANIYFGVFALLWSLFWLDELIISDALQTGTIPFVLLRFLQYLTPAVFFLSVIFYTNPNYRFVWRDLQYTSAPLVFLMLLLFQSRIEPRLFNLIYIGLFLGHALFFTLFAYFKIKRHQRDIELFSASTEEIDLNWLKYIIYAFIGSSVIIIIYSIFTHAESLNIYINVFFLAVVYLVAYHAIRQKEIFPKGLPIKETAHLLHDVVGQSAKNKLMTEQELIRLKEMVLSLMEKEKPYLDSELNLVGLADQLHISGHQLSYLLNTGFGENFFYFINKYRVQKAKELLKSPKYDQLTILAVGFDSGFNSKTSFNTTFKKMTSYTPSQYRQSCSSL